MERGGLRIETQGIQVPTERSLRLACPSVMGTGAPAYRVDGHPLDPDGYRLNWPGVNVALKAALDL